MTPSLRLDVTLGIFAGVLILILVRPRGWNEAWWTASGGAVMLALGLVTPVQAEQVTEAGRSVLLFLLALLLFSALLERSGFFEWAAMQAAKRAGGDAYRLYRNVFLLGAAITVTLSLDTTAVILTPLVLAFVQRLKLPARPYIFACAFVANTASLLLPVSNLTNLLFASAFHLPFAGFVARMLLPQCTALLVTYGMFRLVFQAELPHTFDTRLLSDPDTLIPHKGYFRAAVIILALTLLGYFAAPFASVEPYLVGFAGCTALAAAGIKMGRVEIGLLREVAWPLFPFIIGLFVLVQGVENLGLAHLAAQGLRQASSSLPTGILWTAGGAGAASNLVNNIPAALLAQSVLQTAHAPAPLVYAALLGTNIGPNLTLVGSLATMLVVTTARRYGEEVRGVDIASVGLRVTPPVLAAAALALWLSFLVFQ